MGDIRAEFKRLYVKDVQQFPTAYKQSVRANPEHAAEVLMFNLSSYEVRRLLRDLKEERRRLGA